MALTQVSLENELSKIMNPDDPGFVGFPSSYSDAAANWADAYDNYASNAEDDSGDSVLTVNKGLFESKLSDAWSNTSAWGFTEGAAAFRDAFIGYWTGGIFSLGSLISGTGNNCLNEGPGNRIFLSEISSAVTLVSGANVYTDMLAQLQAYQPSITEMIEAMADIFHRATTSDITVLISGLDTVPPPAGPHPVTNTCKVF